MRQIIFWILIVVIDIFVYLFIGVSLMGYEDNWDSSKGMYGSLSSMNAYEKAIHFLWIAWNIVNLLAIIYFARQSCRWMKRKRGIATTALLILLSTNAFAAYKQKTKYVGTIQDKNHLGFVAFDENPFGNSRYNVGDTVYSVRLLNQKQFGEFVFFYDDELKDTALYFSRTSFDDFVVKRWYRGGKIWELKNVKRGINKAWYPDGSLRYEGVLHDEIIGAEFLYNTKNRSWYPDGKKKYEIVQVAQDTLVEIHYNPNGTPHNKMIHNYPGKEIKRAEWDSVLTFHHIITLRQEFFSENGNLIGYDTREAEKPSYRCAYYYDNGQPRCCAEVYYMYANYGAYTEYFEDGTIKTKGQYEPFDKEKIDKRWEQKTSGESAVSEMKEVHARQESAEKFSSHPQWKHFEAFNKRHEYMLGTKMGVWLHYSEKGELLYTVAYNKNGHVISME